MGNQRKAFSVTGDVGQPAGASLPLSGAEPALQGGDGFSHRPGPPRPLVSFNFLPMNLPQGTLHQRSRSVTEMLSIKETDRS